MTLSILGNIASLVTMAVFKKRFGLDDLSDKDYSDTKGWIVAIATAGAVFGCLGSIQVTARLGRKWTMLLFTLVYIAGVFGQAFSNGSLPGLYVSRVIAGVGIGVTTVLPSVYLSEVGVPLLHFPGPLVATPMPAPY